MPSVPSQSHLMSSGLPQGSRCMGVRVLDPAGQEKRSETGTHDLSSSCHSFKMFLDCSSLQASPSSLDCRQSSCSVLSALVKTQCTLLVEGLQL